MWEEKMSMKQPQSIALIFIKLEAMWISFVTMVSHSMNVSNSIHGDLVLLK
jgi:hypothetical protein